MGVIMRLLSQEKITEAMERFKKRNPNPKPELDFYSPYTLLVAVVLSAQTTDKSVNKVTKELFALADTPQKMLALSQEKIIEIIHPIGLFKNKSKNILLLSQELIEKFDSKVPNTRKELMELSGVGRKTANVILNVGFGEPTMPVDTHLLRICPKIGFAEGKTPEEIEQSLCKRIPSKYMKNAHHWLLLHGRYTCTAKKPKCAECIINDICLHN